MRFDDAGSVTDLDEVLEATLPGVERFNYSADAIPKSVANDLSRILLGDAGTRDQHTRKLARQSTVLALTGETFDLDQDASNEDGFARFFRLYLGTNGLREEFVLFGQEHADARVVSLILQTFQGKDCHEASGVCRLVRAPYGEVTASIARWYFGRALQRAATAAGRLGLDDFSAAELFSTAARDATNFPALARRSAFIAAAGGHLPWDHVPDTTGASRPRPPRRI